MRAIIIAAGDATRWNNYLNTPKHLIEINGEPIIYRTVRLLQDRGISDIHIVGPVDERYKINGCTLFVPNKDTSVFDSDKFLNSQTLWNEKGRTITLLGDVYFTEDAIDSIIGFNEIKWTVFCRFNGSNLTGTKHGELFAQSFYPDDIELHRKNLYYIAELRKNNIIDRCGGWEHYRAMQGLTGSDISIHKNYGNAVEIDDFTEDFDMPSDYDKWISNWNKKYISNSAISD
jgi:hypothetical protein